MSQISPKIIFFGTEDYSLSSLEALVEAGFNVVAAITKPDAPRGRGQIMTEPPVKAFAKNHNIAVWQPTKLKDIEDEIRKLQPVTGVLVAYGKIIPKSTIDLFTQELLIYTHPYCLTGVALHQLKQPSLIKTRKRVSVSCNSTPKWTPDQFIFKNQSLCQVAKPNPNYTIACFR